MKWKLPKWLGLRKPARSSELYVPAPEKSSESNRKTKMQREVDECPVAEPFKGHVTPEASPDNILFETLEPLLIDMTPQHQPSPAGFELYTSNTGNEMPGVEEIDHIEMHVKREGRACKKPRLIKVATLNRSPSPEEEIVSRCPTSAVEKVPPVRAIKQVRSPEKNEETVTRKKPLLIKVATLNRSPSLEEEIVSQCPTSTVTKIPPIRAIKQVRLPEKHEETVTHKKPLLIQVATLNRSPSLEEGIVPWCPTSTVKKLPQVRTVKEERSPEKHEERMTRKKPRLTKEAAPHRSLSPEVEILSLSPIHCAQERKPKISPPPFTKNYAWMEPTSVEVTESEGYTEVTYTEVQEYSSPPASEKEDKEESENEIEVEILPWVEGIKQGQRKKIIDYASPPSTPKPAWMETERDPKIKDAAVVVESKTEVEEDVSTPSATEEHDSIEILNVPIARRQESLFVLPPIPKGNFIPLPDEREYLQRPNNTQEPATNANKNQQSFVNILTFKEWRDSRKRLKKEQKAKKQQKEQLELVLKERYFNDPRMQHLLVNRHNRFNQCR